MWWCNVSGGLKAFYLKQIANGWLFFPDAVNANGEPNILLDVCTFQPTLEKMGEFIKDYETAST
jgi:hypothetical protein